MITLLVGTGQTYPDLASAFTAMGSPSDNYDIQLFPSSGTNGEYTLTAQQLPSASSNSLTFTIRPAPTYGFNENGNKLTSAYRYNPANGIAIKWSSLADSQIALALGAGFVLDGVQLHIDATNGGNVSAVYVNAGSGHVTMKNCIVWMEAAGGSGGGYGFQGVSDNIDVVNNLVYCTAVNGARGVQIGTGGSGANSHIVANTILSLNSVTGTTGVACNASNLVAIDNYVGGFPGGDFHVYAGGFGATTDYNVTDDTTAVGTHSLISKSMANQLTNVSSAAALDVRVKAGADVIGAGTRQQTYTGDLDGLKQARSLTTPTVGAFEYGVSAGGILVPSNMSGGVQNLSGGMSE